MRHNGSDWFEGSPAGQRNAFDARCCPKQRRQCLFHGSRSARTHSRQLDPKTGRVTSYKLTDTNGFAVSTHGIVIDPKGNIWLTNLTEGTVLKFDPKAESFTRFPKPSSMTPRIGGTIAIDSKGNLWTTQTNGAFRLNPETGEYTIQICNTRGPTLTESQSIQRITLGSLNWRPIGSES